MAEEIFFCPFADEWRQVRKTPKDERLEVKDGVQKSETEKTKISLTK